MHYLWVTEHVQKGGMHEWELIPKEAYGISKSMQYIWTLLYNLLCSIYEQWSKRTYAVCVGIAPKGMHYPEAVLERVYAVPFSFALIDIMEYLWVRIAPRGTVNAVPVNIAPKGNAVPVSIDPRVCRRTLPQTVWSESSVQWGGSPWWPWPALPRRGGGRNSLPLLSQGPEHALCYHWV